jgi:hypothetical protein
MGAENKVDGQFEIVIEEHGPGLALADRQDLLQTRRWPSERYHFVLLDPEARVACTPDNRYINGGVVGAHAAYQRRTGILRFMERDFRQVGWQQHPEKLRLLVLRKDFLGSFEKTVHAKVVPGTFRDMFRRQEPVQTERLTAEDFQRRLAELDQPAPGANRAEVGNYVYALLQLAEAYPRITDTDPLVRRLAKLAPEHM